MAEYIDRKEISHIAWGYPYYNGRISMDEINKLPSANVVEKKIILDFIEDNRPTDVQTDWEKGCAYICDEIEKLLM